MANAINRTIRDIPHFDTFLADYPRAIAGWGRKPSGRRAMRLAAVLGRPFVLLEDGFIRSVARDEPPLSLLVDDLGIYYDARSASRMEAVIAAGTTAGEATRARALIAAWCEARLSKYNHAPETAPLHGGGPFVLVADQCRNDLSVTGGLADGASFAAMLEAALGGNPDCRVLVKLHPDMLTHQRQGYFPLAALDHPRITVISADCHAAGLVAEARAVYTVTSLIGFEGLLWGKPVHCFGMPFYAGWGLTRDAIPAPARRGAARIEDLVHAAFVVLARYADPASGLAWEPEQTIQHAARGRAQLLAAQLRNGRPGMEPAPHMP